MVRKGAGMKRIKDGFRLVGQSWEVIRREPLLLLVIALGLVATVVTAAALFLLVLRRAPEAADFRWPNVLWILPITLVAGIPSTVATGTVIATAMDSLEGKDASVRKAFTCTMRKFPQLVAWSIVAGIVGMFIQLVAQKLDLGGKIAAALAGMSWAVATMFVIPILLYEDLGPVESAKRSVELVKRRWGEGITGYASMGMAVVIVFLALLALAIPVTYLNAIAGMLLLGTAFFGMIFFVTTLQGVFNAALYRFAVSGTAAGPYTSAQLESTFTTEEKEKKKPGYRAWKVVGYALVGIYVVLKALDWADVVAIPGL